MTQEKLERMAYLTWHYFSHTLNSSELTEFTLLLNEWKLDFDRRKL